MTNQRWSSKQAWAWINARPWLCGFNFLPSSAVNTTEMWQAESFDAATIDRELGWAQAIGLNSCRVFLQFLVWKDDPAGQKDRMEHFLRIADKHSMSTMFILFDDCAFSGKQPYLGPQADPVAGIHNSGWTPSPGWDHVVDRSQWPDLQAYVQDLVSTFAQDQRIVAWDLYNEPGNSKMGNDTLPLLEATFGWARLMQPTQPLTVGTWHSDLNELNQCSLDRSDLISFHAYSDLESTRKMIEQLEPLGRPLLCTEWMARTRHSNFETHLPLFKQARVGCYMWGLVQGRTQTYYPWGSPAGAPEPALWHHDIFRTDGTLYRSQEIALIRQHTIVLET